MKRCATIVASIVCAFSSGCVYHYGATVTFTAQPGGSHLQDLQLSSPVAGAASVVVTKIGIDASLREFVKDCARSAGYLSGELDSLAITPTKREREKEAVHVSVFAISHAGERKHLSGSFVITGGWIRGTKPMEGLSVDSTGVVVQPTQGTFREFAISDAAVLRAAIMIAVQRAFAETKEPNPAPEPTGPGGRGSP